MNQENENENQFTNNEINGIIIITAIIIELLSFVVLADYFSKIIPYGGGIPASLNFAAALTLIITFTYAFTMLSVIKIIKIIRGN